MPPEVDWMIHRVATSGKYVSGLIEIQTQWSLDDLLDATIVLDTYSRLEERVTRDR